jgi:chemotaxis protein MotB
MELRRNPDRWLGRLLVLVPILFTACITTNAHNAKVAELEASAAAKEAAAQARIKALEEEKAALEEKLAEVRSALKTALDEKMELLKHLDDSTALASELSKRLEKLGQNVDKLTSERGQLSVALDDTKQRLEELRKQKAAAEALANTFKSLVQKLKSMIDAGQLKVVIRDGRMLIALPNDVLFDSGKTAIKKEAQVALTQVAQVLSSINDRRFLVAGHTDDVPIRTAQFPSNWELSTGRAVEVTKFLVARGMKPQVLAAAGYGEFDPVSPNSNTENRALNRRIEIVLQPNLSELPAIEGLTPGR